jgi:hypothetical protein
MEAGNSSRGTTPSSSPLPPSEPLGEWWKDRFIQCCALLMLVIGALFLATLLGGCGLLQQPAEVFRADVDTAARSTVQHAEANLTALAAKPAITTEDVRAVVSGALSDFGVQLGNALQKRADESMDPTTAGGLGGAAGVALTLVLGFLKRLTGARAST